MAEIKASKLVPLLYDALIQKPRELTGNGQGFFKFACTVKGTRKYHPMYLILECIKLVLLRKHVGSKIIRTLSAYHICRHSLLRNHTPDQKVIGYC